MSSLFGAKYVGKSRHTIPPNFVLLKVGPSTKFTEYDGHGKPTGRMHQYWYDPTSESAQSLDSLSGSQAYRNGAAVKRGSLIRVECELDQHDKIILDMLSSDEAGVHGGYLEQASA